jgi:hypothetical protein
MVGVGVSICLNVSSNRILHVLSRMSIHSMTRCQGPFVPNTWRHSTPLRAGAVGGHDLTLSNISCPAAAAASSFVLRPPSKSPAPMSQDGGVGDHIPSSCPIIPFISLCWYFTWGDDKLLLILLDARGFNDKLTPALVGLLAACLARLTNKPSIDFQEDSFVCAFCQSKRGPVCPDMSTYQNRNSAIGERHRATDNCI